MEFTRDGKSFEYTSSARFLLETANGTSSYTLVRGYGPLPEQALRDYEELTCSRGKKKRLTMVDGKKRTVVARDG